ncbi:MAG: tetratricopeptide repeat protein [Flavobacteriales bacterium]|nr:MAG: tetratricopeptide repeat protein [Flavobacteriales bacterium]
MLPALEPDLKNIGEWTATAARQHAQGDHREALMNLRNAGETACRTIVRIAWPGPRGEEAVRGSTYDLLLRLIQGKALAPAEVVSALHVLRTRGNNATHGKPVTGSDSAGALFMAHTLVQHVYTGLLQRRVPQAAADGLAKAMGSATQHEQQAVLKEVLQQETRESAPPAPVGADPADVRRLQDEQELHRNRIGDMEALLRQLAEREAQQRAAVVEVVAPPAAVAPGRRRWWPWAAAGGLVVMAAAGYWAARGTAPAEPGPVVAVADTTITTALILPLAVLQDNPGLALHFEEALAARLREHTEGEHPALRIIVADTTLAAAPTEDQAHRLAEQHAADVVLYGELFEPTATDSGRLAVQFVGTSMGRWPKGDLDTLAFRTLTDSGAVRALRAAQALVKTVIAQRYYGDNRPSDALAVLYNVPLVLTDGITTVHLMRARCHRLMGDFGPALREMEAALALKPTDPDVLAYMGRVLKENGNLTAAIGYYEKAIAQQPGNANWMMALVGIVGTREHPEHFDPPYARRLCQQALAADSSNAGAWELHGEILIEDKRYGDARRALERALDLDPGYTYAKYQLAQVLAVRTKPPDLKGAQRLLREVVGADSTNTHAMLLLGQVLGKGSLEDRALADRLLRKTQHKDPRWELAALQTRARAAYDTRNDTLAMRLLREVWAVDSSDVTYGVKMAVLHGDNNEAAAVDMLLRCYAIDSMHHMVNLNLGIHYLKHARTNDQRKPALFHLERALATDPYDPFTLSELGVALVEQGNLVRAQTMLERLLRAKPDDFVGNAYMGIVHLKSNRYTEAVPLLRRALALQPEDPTLAIHLATTYMHLQPVRAADARTVLERALQHRPSEPMLHLHLYSALLVLKDNHRAADHYRQAIALDPQLRSDAVEKGLSYLGVW